MNKELQFGAPCRARCSAPARYIGFGKCLYVSAMCNDLGVDLAKEPTGNESDFPLPSTLDVIRYANEEAIKHKEAENE